MQQLGFGQSLVLTPLSISHGSSAVDKDFIARYGACGCVAGALLMVCALYYY